MKKLFFLLLIYAIQPSLKAQPGALDPTFGNNGITNIYKEFRRESATDMAVTKDGKILIMTADFQGQYFKRFLPSGTPDSSFGESGTLLINLFGGDVTPFTFTIDSSNRIVLVGWEDIMDVVRLLEDGTVDNSFGAVGYQQAKMDYMSDAMLVQSDGKIVIAGQFGGKARIKRFNDDGSKDLTFNSTSMIDLQELDPSFAFGLAQQSDGKIVVTGTCHNDLFVARLNTNGTLDNTFASVGYNVIEDSDAEAGQDVAVLPDGKIIISGYSKTPVSSKLICWRFLSDGSIDNSFGSNGIGTLYSGLKKNYGWSIIAQTDTSAMVIGSKYIDEDDYHPIVFHVLNSGELDPNFGTDGSAYPNYRLGTPTQVIGAATTDHKILLCGTAFDNGDNMSVLSQFNSNGSMDSTFGALGTEMVFSDTSYYYFGQNADCRALSNNNTLCVTTPRADLCLFQLKENGSLDSTYGQGGFSFVNNHYGSYDVFMAQDTNYVYLAESHFDDYNYEDLLSDSTIFKISIYRFDQEGLLDTSYGMNGVSEPLFVNNYVGKCSNITIQNDGKQLIAGIGWRLTDIPTDDYKYPFLFRLNANGSIDSSFGSNGIDVFEWGVGEYASVTARDDGKIIFESLYYDSALAFTTTGIMQLKSDGSIDSTYGDNGFIEFPEQTTSGNGCWWMNGILVSILVNWYPYPVIYNLLNQNADGSIDSSFGINGKISLALGASNNVASALLSLPDDKIASVGPAFGTSVMKFNDDGSIDSTFGIDGISTTSVYGGDKICLDDENRILVCGFDVPYFSIFRLLNDVATSSPSIESSSQLQVYPNPASAQLIINYPFSSNEEATIFITDVTGKILHEEKVNASSDHYVMKVNDLASGIYFLTLKTKSESNSVKVVKE